MEAQHFFDIGVDKIRKQDFNGAIEAFTKTILLTSSNDRRTISEKHSDGSTSHVDIVEMSEGRGNVRFNRGIAYMAIGKFEEAIEDFSKEIEYAPNDAEFYYHRAIAFYSIGRDNEAGSDLTRANQLDPKYTKELFLSQFP